MNNNEFVHTIMDKFYEHIHNYEKNNYDEYRYSFDKIDRSIFFDMNKHRKYFDYFINNHSFFYKTYNLLSDLESKNLFIQLILFRLLGHLHVRIKNEYNSIVESANRNALTKISKPSQFTNIDKYGNLFHFPNIQYNGHNISLDCRHVNIISSFLKKQYRLHRSSITVTPNAGDIVLDCGGCFGDTAISFACDVKNNGKILVFEPLPSYINIIKHNILQNNFSNRIKICPYAVGRKTLNINSTFIEENIEISPGFSTVEMTDKVPIISIDDFVENEQIKKINFIKMDIEGSELDALKGAQKTITRHKPKLAISLYHKIEDFIKIPIYISQQHPKYNFYIDHYTIHDEETVLYCI